MRVGTRAVTVARSLPEYTVEVETLIVSDFTYEMGEYTVEVVLTNTVSSTVITVAAAVSKQTSAQI